jgi:hypothetical protein
LNRPPTLDRHEHPRALGCNGIDGFQKFNTDGSVTPASDGDAVKRAFPFSEEVEPIRYRRVTDAKACATRGYVSYRAVVHGASVEKHELGPFLCPPSRLFSIFPHRALDALDGRCLENMQPGISIW